jgi:hypothetical protein
MEGFGVVSCHTFYSFVHVENFQNMCAKCRHILTLKSASGNHDV